MYKLFIIDDEPLILKGIRNIIDWNAYGFDEIRTFSNPLKAHEAILESKPDVILADIKMPMMTGLDLLESCRKEDVKSLFVLVTAYSEFEYAKQAVENGAFSYVLKPLNRKLMLALAEKLRDSLDTTRQTELAKTVRTLVLQALTTGIQPEMGAFEGIAYLNQPYRICFTSYKPEFDGIWFKIYDDLYIGILADVRTLKPDAAAGLSRVADGSQMLFARIREALTAYYTLRFHGRSSELLEFEAGDVDIPEYLDEIIRAITIKNYKRVKALLPLLKEQTILHCTQLDEMTYMYNNILSAFCAKGGDISFGEEIRPFGNCLSMYSVLHNVETMFESLVVLTENAINEKYGNAQDSSALVRASIQFIDENFTTPITLEQISERFNISISHMSRQFKSVTGKNFSDYIRDKRIAHACRLLETTDLTIGDVGALCGYEDYFHFSKVFKKSMGLAPSKYRENR